MSMPKDSQKANFELDGVARMSLSDQEEEIGEIAAEENREALKLAVLDNSGLKILQ